MDLLKVDSERKGMNIEEGMYFFKNQSIIDLIILIPIARDSFSIRSYSFFGYKLRLNKLHKLNAHSCGYFISVALRQTADILIVTPDSFEMPALSLFRFFCTTFLNRTITNLFDTCTNAIYTYTSCLTPHSHITITWTALSTRTQT